VATHGGISSHINFCSAHLKECCASYGIPDDVYRDDEYPWLLALEASGEMQAITLTEVYQYSGGLKVLF